MAYFVLCSACEEGRHEDHRKVIKPPPARGVGGDVCPCDGECDGNTPPMSPAAEAMVAALKTFRLTAPASPRKDETDG